MVALDYFRRLGHDNHHRLFQVYGWDEKKTKTSWGGTSVDHEKLAEARIRAMAATDFNRSMVTCALVPDLYCPGYGEAQRAWKSNNNFGLRQQNPRNALGSVLTNGDYGRIVANAETETGLATNFSSSSRAPSALTKRPSPTGLAY